MPRVKRKELPGQRTLDVFEQRSERANLFGFYAVELIWPIGLFQIVKMPLACLLHVKTGWNDSSHNTTAVVKASFDMRERLT